MPRIQPPEDQIGPLGPWRERTAIDPVAFVDPFASTNVVILLAGAI
jgi:hypothetical protein